MSHALGAVSSFGNEGMSRGMEMRNGFLISYRTQVKLIFSDAFEAKSIQKPLPESMLQIG